MYIHFPLFLQVRLLKRKTSTKTTRMRRARKKVRRTKTTILTLIPKR